MGGAMAGATGRIPGFLPELTAAGPRRDPSLVPFVAIQILVLAFFIVLTAHADRDSRRSREVTESIQAKFAGLDIAEKSGPQVGAADAGVSKALHEAMTTFQGLVPLEDSLVQVSATEQYLRLPLELFFAAGSSDVKQPIHSLLAQLMRALDSRPDGWGYEVEIAISLGAQESLALDRAASLATALAGGKAKDEFLTVALGKGDPDWLVLLVRLRPDSTGIKPIETAPSELDVKP
jgi:hypothetical protein